MKNYFLLFLISVVFCNFTNAQFNIQSFTLDTFKLPILDRKALSIGGTLSTHHNSLDETGFEYHSKDSGLSSSQSVLYTHYQNRPDLQAFLYLASSPNFSFYTRKIDGQVDMVNNYFRPDLLFYTYHRNYSGNQFFELGYGSSVNYSYQKNAGEFSDITNNQERKSIDGNAYIDLAIGNGRIEPISDLSLALFMLQDAVELGVNPADIHQEDIYDFAQLMAVVQNERVFDSRKKRIYELRTLYDFMESKGWVVPNDPGFFTVLTDNWIFTTYNFRNTGKRWRFGFTPEYILDGQKTVYTDTFTTKYTDHTFEGSLYAQFDKVTPINVHKDNFRSHELKGTVSTLLYGGNGPSTNPVYFDLDFNNTFGRNWYPNSRTQIATALELNYLYHDRLDEVQFGINNKRHGLMAALTGNANYFISYRTQLRVDASVSYSWNAFKNYFITPDGPVVIDSKSNGFNAYLNASIAVSIF